MTDFTGLVADSPRFAQNPDRSVNIDGFGVPPEIGGGTLVSSAKFGVRSRETTRTWGRYTGPVVNRDPGARWWFERIHLVPGTLNAGVILSDKEYEVEVASTYRRITQVLDAIEVTGTGADGITVEDDDGVPVEYRPLRSRLYVVTIAQTGEASIRAAVIWDFQGIGEPALLVIGTRLVPFAFRFQWPIADGYGFLTEIIRAATDDEQRVQLRDEPRRIIGAQVVAIEGDDAARMLALLFGWSHQAYGVPIWWDAMTLAAPIAPGAESFTVLDATLRELEIGMTMLLWLSPGVWEAVEIESIVSNTIGVTFPIEGGWGSANTVVLPIRLGRLTREPDITRWGPHMAETDIEFEVDEP